MVGVPVLIVRKVRGIRVSKLSAGTCTPGEQTTFFRNRDCMGFATSYLFYNDLGLISHKFYYSRSRLIRTPIFVLWHQTSIRVSQLPTAASAPSEDKTFFSKCSGVGIAACYLDDRNVEEA